MTAQNKNTLGIAKIAGFIMLIPFFGDMFVEGWNWGVADFILAFVLLFSAGLAMDLASKKMTKPLHRYAAVALIVLILFVLWVEIATGGVTRMLGLWL